MNLKESIILLTHAFIGWLLCGLIVFLGRLYFFIDEILILHAIIAPIIFIIISYIYFTKYNFSSPIRTAIIVLIFILFMDIFIVSMMIEKNFDMFGNILGTWIPLTLIFLSVFFTGLCITKCSYFND